MIDKLMAATEGLPYEELSFVFLFGVTAVGILTLLAFVLPSIANSKR